MVRPHPQVQLVDASTPGEVRLDPRPQIVDAPAVLSVDYHVTFVAGRADRSQRSRHLCNLIDCLTFVVLVRRDVQRLLPQVGDAFTAGRNVGLSPQ